MIDTIEVHGELTTYAARLRPDGNHAMQLRFTIQRGGQDDQLDELLAYLSEYCAVTINAGYNSDGKGEEISLSAVLNGYKGKPSKDAGAVFDLGFLVPMREYSGALSRIIMGDVVAKSCRVRVAYADPQEPLPFGLEREGNGVAGDEQQERGQ